MIRVQGVPELLDAYSDDTLSMLDRVRSALGDCREAVAAFNAAEPNDLGGRVADGSVDLLDVVDALEVLDRIPAAFAAALRELDAGYDPAALGPALVLHAEADGQLRRLLLTGVAGRWASGAERARVAGVLRRWDDTPDAPPPLVAATRADDWRGAVNQFSRHLGNGVLTGVESRRLADLRVRYPVSHAWLNPSGYHADQLARAAGTHNRVVLQAGRSADEAATALRANSPLLPSLGVHLPSGLLRAGKTAGGAVGFAGAVITVADTFQDVDDRDWAGVASNTASLAGSGLLFLSGGPITMTAGAVLVVGSLIYEANREEIDAMAGRVVQCMSGVARSISGIFDF